MTIPTNQLIAAYEHEAKQAATTLEGKRKAALQSIEDMRDALSEQITADAQRFSLSSMIDEALEDSELSRDEVIATINHLVAAFIHNPTVKAGNGEILIAVLPDVLRQIPDATKRHRAVEAVLLAASAPHEISAGLFTWPHDWTERATLAALELFASTLAPEAHTEHTANLATLKADHAEAVRLAGILSAPVTITPTMVQAPASSEPMIAIRNHTLAALPLTIAGISIRGNGAITRISRAQFEQVQQSPIWKSGLVDKSLEVMQP